jgi:hypothetical protein
MATTPRRRGILICAFALVLACGPEVEIPRPPIDAAPIAAIYVQPTGTLDPSRFGPLFVAVAERRAASEGARLADVVTDVLVRLGERLQAGGFPTNPRERTRDLSRLNGFVTLEQICAGWDTSVAEPDVRDGSVSVTATVKSGSLARTVWGTAVECRARVPIGDFVIVNSFLNGDLWIYLENGIPTSIEDARFIVGFAGTLGGEPDVTRVTLSFDLRYVHPRTEVRVPVDDGDVIVTFVSEGLGVRARNGTFACTNEPPACGPTP